MQQYAGLIDMHSCIRIDLSVFKLKYTFGQYLVFTNKTCSSLHSLTINTTFNITICLLSLGTGGENIEPDIVFKERWKQKEARIRRESVVGHLRGWRLLPVIVKTNDDLRQEQCAAQLIAQMHQILLAGGCESWLRPYDIIALTEDAGLIEAIPDTVSLDALKKKDKHYTTLCDFYERFFGVEGRVSVLSYSHLFPLP